MKTSTLTPERLHQINAYGRAANYARPGLNLVHGFTRIAGIGGASASGRPLPMPAPPKSKGNEVHSWIKIL